MQAAPLRVNDVGAALVPECDPLNPNWADAPGASEAFHGAFVAVTWLPDWVTVLLHDWVTCWPDGKLQRRVQPASVELPVLVTVTAAVKPVFHWFTP